MVILLSEIDLNQLVNHSIEKRLERSFFPPFPCQFGGDSQVSNHFKSNHVVLDLMQNAKKVMVLTIIHYHRRRLFAFRDLRIIDIDLELKIDTNDHLYYHGSERRGISRGK